MQTTSAPLTYAYPPAQNVYQPPTESEIYAIKKQYLELLPPLQVIDICLTFEAHAPLHVKSSVWPYDIRAAIAAIQANKPQESQPQISSHREASAKPPEAEETSPTPQPNATTPQPSSPAPNAAAGPSTTSTPTSPPALAQPSTRPLPSASLYYPRQPFYHPSYPHTPYYPPQATYSYSHTFPPYSPLQYSQGPPTQPPLFTNTPLPQTPHIQDQHSPPVPPPPPSLNASDDLPSYEEMIVAALLDCGDPEGCAPKALFSWMAMHYPLQTNFRPSASQALQKAYKRGRLEKGINGRYRLNENWEGGNTSRRTTRRPQTLAQAAGPGSQPPAPASSPFTHRPLVPHGPQMGSPGQPPGYAGYPHGIYQGALPPPHPHLPTIGYGPFQPKQAAEGTDHETGEGSDAWEAAQNILKAINFGQLLRMADEITGGGSGTPSTERNLTEHQSAPPTDMARDPAPPFPGDRETADSESQITLDGEQRAALQAQLALLAVQLAELADVSGNEFSQDLSGVQGEIEIAVPESSGIDEDDEVDMVEVPVPTSSIHP